MALFLTQDHIQRYGVIYRLLNRVRNCHIRLESMGTIRSTNVELALCRFKMVNWINLIENYFHIEVIEFEWKTLRETFDSKDVKQFIATHERYLHAISKKCFLVQRALMNTFIAVIEICEQFASNANMEQYQLFNRSSRYFYDLIVKMNSEKSEHHLASLTLGLNFNGKMACQLNY